MKLQGTGAGSAQFGRSSDADKARLAQAARQFEALLMKQVVKSMQGPLRKGATGPGRGMYDTLADDALAQHLSRGNGTGIAKTLYRQWTGESLPGELTSRPSATNLGVQTTMATPQSAPMDAETGVSWIDDGSRPLHQMMPPDGLENTAQQRDLPTPIPEPIAPVDEHVGWDDGRPLRELLPPDGTENKLSLNNPDGRHDNPPGGVLFRNGDNENGYQKPRRNTFSLNGHDPRTKSPGASRQRVIRAYRASGG